MASKRDFYEVLEITKESTTIEIKKAYKKKAIAHHPDRNPGDDEAIEKFKEASEAYEVLSDEKKRSLYDRYGHAGLGAGAGGGSQFHDVSDIFEAFGDLFGSSFGGGGRQTRNRPRKGPNLRASIQIELLEAASGCEKEISIARHKSCETCSGSGAKPGSSPDTCDYCNGAGRVVQSQGFFQIQTACPACQGVGTVIRDKCETCSGEGNIPEKVKLDVNIPAGVDNGMQLCLRGEGEAGTNGGPNGDLYVDIIVENHSLFERDGKDLFCNVPITFTQAALGTDIDVPVLDGRYSLNIPSGTQPSTEFRLRGKGMPDPHGRRTGDLFVTVQVEVPQKLDEKQEELIRELAELEKSQVSSHRKTFFEKLKDYFVSHESDE